MKALGKPAAAVWRGLLKSSGTSGPGVASLLMTFSNAYQALGGRDLLRGSSQCVQTKISPFERSVDCSYINLKKNPSPEHDSARIQRKNVSFTDKNLIWVGYRGEDDYKKTCSRQWKWANKHRRERRTCRLNEQQWGKQWLKTDKRRVEPQKLSKGWQSTQRQAVKWNMTHEEILTEWSRRGQTQLKLRNMVPFCSNAATTTGWTVMK